MNKEPKISLIMGSKSDWKVTKYTAELLELFEIPHEILVISAHRTPKRMIQFGNDAENRGIKIIIAAAGGAAHLPGMVASLTNLPVIAIPVQSKNLGALDSLLSIVQMPAGVPVATMAIGEAGAKNAALMAASILALSDDKIKEKYDIWREKLTKDVPFSPVD